MKTLSFRTVSCLILAVIVMICSVGCNEDPAVTSSDIGASESDISSTVSSDDSSSSFEDAASSEIELSDKNNVVEETESTDDGDPDSEKYKSSKKIDVLGYSVVYDNDLTTTQQRTVYKISRAFFKAGGEYPEYNSDVELSKNGAAKNEILVSYTDRNESEKAVSALRKNRTNCYYDYIIAVINGKIVIHSLSESGLEEGIEFFIDTFLTEDGENTIPADYNYIHTENISTCMSIDGLDVSNYVITCEEYPAMMLYKGCEELQQVIEEKTDFKMPIVKTDDVSDYPNRIEVSIDGNDRNAYSISMKNGNILIKAGHNYSANAALHTLSANIKNIEEGYTFNIPKNYKLSGTYNAETSNTDTYKLVWSDEFDGNSINTDYWNVNGQATTDTSQKGLSMTAFKQGDYVAMLKSNVKVKDGYLNLIASKTNMGNGNTAWWGSDLHCDGVYFQYGLFEIKAKINAGEGFWPAFWANGEKTLDKNYNPEIDVFEFFGNDIRARSNMHSWWMAGRTVAGLSATDAQITQGHIQHLSEEDNNTYNLPGNKAYSDDFHTFACEWTPDYIKFSVDGYTYCTVDMESFLTDPNYGYAVNEYMMFLNKPVRIILGTSVGNVLGGVEPNEKTILPSTFYVDYVHLYQQDGVGTLEFRN